jgi:hypothetical protein
LADAAKSAGRSKSALLRSIKAGRLSANRDELTGAWTVDVSELHRIYPPMSGAERSAVNDAPHTSELRARLSDALDQIQDLRRQRDRADDERRRAQEQLAGLQNQMAALLADQRPAPAAPTPAPIRRKWWPWNRRR